MRREMIIAAMACVLADLMDRVSVAAGVIAHRLRLHQERYRLGTSFTKSRATWGNSWSCPSGGTAMLPYGGCPVPVRGDRPGA